MSRRGGFPGGQIPGGMTNMLKQAQKMQRQMEAAQKELEEKEITATAGGGAVSVTMTGKHEVKKITISPDAVDPDDVETLEDLVTAAVNEAVKMVNDASQQSMSKISGGISPDIFG